MTIFWSINFDYTVSSAEYLSALSCLERFWVSIEVLAGIWQGNRINLSDLCVNFCDQNWCVHVLNPHFCVSFPRRKTIQMHMGGMHVEVCSFRWTNAAFPQAHRNQTLPVSRLWPELFTFRPSCSSQETPHASLNVFCPWLLTHFFCFLHVHFNLDSAGLDLWVYTIKSLHMVSNRCYLTLLCPCHGSDLKNVNTSFFSPGDAKQTLSPFSMFIVFHLWIREFLN